VVNGGELTATPFVNSGLEIRSQYKKPEFSFSHVHFQCIIYSLPRKEDQSITAASQVL
jgi:hypothetical protein